MAATEHRMQGDVQTVTVALSAHRYRRGIRCRRRRLKRPHGWAQIYSRLCHVAVFDALLGVPWCDSGAMLILIALRIVVFLLRTDLIQNDPQQPGTGSFQKPFGLHSHLTSAAPLGM